MLNVVAIMGRMVKDPDLRTTQSGISVTSFTLAVDRSYAKQGEERQCDFIDVVCWRGQADFVCKYFSKGQLIAVQGSIQTRSYTDRDGNKRKAVEIVADHVHFAEPKRDTGNKNTYGTAPYKPDISADDSDEMSDSDLPF